MRTFIKESANVVLRSRVTDSDPGSDAAVDALLTRGDASATLGLTWLTVGLGVLVIGLAMALTVLAIVR